MQKENKRCIPKEGMPHAYACKKKEVKMHTQRRYATCLGMSKKRKRGKERDIPFPKRKKKRDGSYKGVHPSYTNHKKNTHIYTLAHPDQDL